MVFWEEVRFYSLMNCILYYEVTSHVSHSTFGVGYLLNVAWAASFIYYFVMILSDVGDFSGI